MSPEAELKLTRGLAASGLALVVLGSVPCLLLVAVRPAAIVLAGLPWFLPVPWLLVLAMLGRLFVGCAARPAAIARVGRVFWSVGLGVSALALVGVLVVALVAVSSDAIRFWLAEETSLHLAVYWSPFVVFTPCVLACFRRRTLLLGSPEESAALHVAS